MSFRGYYVLSLFCFVFLVIKTDLLNMAYVWSLHTILSQPMKNFKALLVWGGIGIQEAIEFNCQPFLWGRKMSTRNRREGWEWESLLRAKETWLSLIAFHQRKESQCARSTSQTMAESRGMDGTGMLNGRITISLSLFF